MSEKLPANHYLGNDISKICQTNIQSHQIHEVILVFLMYSVLSSEDLCYLKRKQYVQSRVMLKFLYLTMVTVQLVKE